MSVDDVAMIATSFPDFHSAMERLGAEFRRGANRGDVEAFSASLRHFAKGINR